MMVKGFLRAQKIRLLYRCVIQAMHTSEPDGEALLGSSEALRVSISRVGRGLRCA